MSNGFPITVDAEHEAEDQVYDREEVADHLIVITWTGCWVWGFHLKGIPFLHRLGMEPEGMQQCFYCSLKTEVLDICNCIIDHQNRSMKFIWILRIYCEPGETRYKTKASDQTTTCPFLTFVASFAEPVHFSKILFLSWIRVYSPLFVGVSFCREAK